MSALVNRSAAAAPAGEDPPSFDSRSPAARPGAAAVVGDGWSAWQIPAGVWLSPGTWDSTRAAAAGRVAPDPQRLTVVVDADRPGPEVTRAVEAMLGLLPPQGPRAVRLVLSLVDGALAQGLADRFDLDLVAAGGHLLTAPDGLLAVTGFHPDRLDTFWQWRRYRPNHPAEECGALHPCPPWELALLARGVRPGKVPGVPDARVQRMPAGLVLHQSTDPASGFLRSAGFLRPDPDHLTLLVRAVGPDATMLDAVGAVLAALARWTPCRVRLLWPYAAAPELAGDLQGLSDRFGAELTAPDGDVLPSGPSGLRAAGRDGAGNWVRFAPHVAPLPLGPVIAVDPGPAAPTVTVSQPTPAPLDPAVVTAPAPEPAPEPTPAPVAAAPEPAPAPEPAHAAVTAPEPAPEPEPEPEPAAPPEPVRAVLLVARDHASSPDERRRYREEAGSRHEKHVVAVARTLAQRPALRGASPRSSREAEDVVAADLAALRAYLCGEPLTLDLVLRTADPSPAQAHAACLVSGLRVLPAYRGAVFRSAHLTPEASAAYRPGRVLLEPGFTAGATSLAGVPGPQAGAATGADAGAGAVRYAVWSQTARRTGWLDTGSSDEEVLFVAGTEFLVLAMEPGAGDDKTTLVFLRENPRAAAQPGNPDTVELTDADRTILERLRAAFAAALTGDATARSGARGGALAPKVATPTARSQPRHRFPIGLDANGLPFHRS